MNPRLQAYLSRIGYDGPLALDFQTLRALHRAHLLAISYENLDIHLGVPLTLDEEHIFEKIVSARRGGWCYEMNGLFAWALRELGFNVTLLGGAVNRQENGDRANLNHLVLLVALERPYLADVGFGNGFLEPLPLEEGMYQQGFLDYRLSREGARWIFRNHAYGGAGFDFSLDPYRLADFSARCHELQTSPESGFVRVTVCHRFTPHGLVSLRGAVLRTLTREGNHEQLIDDPATYRQVLREQFDLHVDTSRLWPNVWQRHLEWAQSRAI